MPLQRYVPTRASKTPSVAQRPRRVSPSARPEDRAERRQVTVMFSDLVGSTALSARMDPEDLREVIWAYQKCVAETVQRFGGFVAKYMGDGVLIYFGYPQAHEDDAERAVRAGLELIQAVDGLKSQCSTGNPRRHCDWLSGHRRSDRIWCCSGTSGRRGDTKPRRASAGIAEPTCVVIAESTRKLLGNPFELEDLGGKDLKGIAGPVRAWAALRPSSVESRFEALRTATTPLVGRDEEVDLLLRRWDQAKRGEGCVVLISGEPGIGKSRVAQTIVGRLGDEPHTRLRYFCSPYHQDSALYPSYCPARAGGRLPARGYGRAAARQTRGGPGPRRPMISVRPCLCWRTCCRSRPATAIRRSISPRRSARRKRLTL